MSNDDLRQGQAVVQALRGVDLEVFTGEMLMLVGPSGCGKTTLISTIAGVIQRDGGEHSGFVFQALNLNPTLTAAENVSAPLMLNGMKRAQTMLQARDFLGRVGFDARMMEPLPSDISGGQRHRLATLCRYRQPGDPLILLGATEPVHVRVDVDGNDAWRIKSGAAATGFLRGNKNLKTAMRFVRFEPYVVPKKSLTGDSTERVDTRVLQVIYSFDRGSLPIYVGQQMDVFIDAPDLENLP